MLSIKINPEMKKALEELAEKEFSPEDLCFNLDPASRLRGGVFVIDAK